MGATGKKRKRVGKERQKEVANALFGDSDGSISEEGGDMNV